MYSFNDSKAVWHSNDFQELKAFLIDFNFLILLKINYKSNYSFIENIFCSLKFFTLFSSNEWMNEWLEFRNVLLTFFSFLRIISFFIILEKELRKFLFNKILSNAKHQSLFQKKSYLFFLCFIYTFTFCFFYISFIPYFKLLCT